MAVTTKTKTKTKKQNCEAAVVTQIPPLIRGNYTASRQHLNELIITTSTAIHYHSLPPLPSSTVPPQSRIPLSSRLQSCPLQRPWPRMPVPHSAETQGPVFNKPERATTVNGGHGETARLWESAIICLSYLSNRGTNPCRPAGCMASAIGAAGVLQERGQRGETSMRGKRDQVCSCPAAV